MLTPVNFAILLFLAKLVIVPGMVMVAGPTRSVLPWMPSVNSMEWALWIDVIAYVAFCCGLQAAGTRAPGRLTRIVLSQISTTPSRTMVAAFAICGIVGFLLTFSSPAQVLQYLSDPLKGPDKVTTETTVTQLLGTLLRPFFAFSLIAGWSRLTDRPRGPHWQTKLVLASVFAAAGVVLANLTFSFNRASFVFPLMAMAAVYHARVKRIPAWKVGLAACVAMPFLIAVGAYRSDAPFTAAPFSMTETLRKSVDEVSGNLEVYVGGPQFTGFFYERIDWGSNPLGGPTLIASVLTPIPVVGKSFRQTNGPAIYNRAIYGGLGFEDQIIPFATELFLNFHVVGVLGGFLLLGMLLASFEQYLDYVPSAFGTFAVQYAMTWAAMLLVWSVSVYSQILFYYFWPVYVFVGLRWARSRLRTLNRSRQLSPAQARGMAS
jgi:hypothetical protein